MLKNIILFGGSFDPIHNGHIDVANKTIIEYNFDELWFLPSRNHPLKGELSTIDIKDRLHLIELAIVGNKKFKIRLDEIEFDLKYSYDSIHHFKKLYPNYNFIFLMGSDNLYNFKKWYNYKRIPEIINIVIYSRDGYLENLYEHKNIQFLSEKIIKISSTEIRNKIANKLDVKTMLPESVFNYIREKKLYQ